MTIRANRSPDTALRVAVLVTLEQGRTAGGHVKCWERFAEAATRLPQDLDLTVHFLGDRAKIVPLAGNVRFQHHKPVFGTRALPFLDQGAGHTDLAPYHPALARALNDRDVIHTTDCFSFGRTGQHQARRQGKGLTASVHTDMPQFTRIYAGDIITRLAGKHLGSWLTERRQVPARIAARMADRIDRRLAACDHVLVSKPEDHDRLALQIDTPALSYLRRGIDRARFGPAQRDRAWLCSQHGIPENRRVLMFAGRVDASKSVMVMAEAAKLLIDQGQDIQALVVGKGDESARIVNLLGDRATLPGNVDQAMLARLYASADLFLFPSMTEVCPNVVIEAKASGLPVLVASAHGGAQFIATPGQDGLIIADQQPASWAAAASDLLADPASHQAMAAASLDWAAAAWPSWHDVLTEDLLQPWRRAARLAHNAARAGHQQAATKGIASGRISWGRIGES